MSAFGNTARTQFRFSAGGRITWAVQRLILITGGIFALQLMLRPVGAYLVAMGMTDPIDWLTFQSSNFLRGYLWQPFTYMFLHGGLWHLVMNLFTLFIFGPDVERELGTPKFYRLYLFCGAVGVLASLLPMASGGLTGGNILGASGATLGVMVAFVYLDPKRQFFMLPLPFPITAMGLLVIVVVLNLITALQGSGVSVATHFGGMGAGYAFMKLVPMYTQWQRRRRFRVVPKEAPPKTSGASESWSDVGKVVNDILKDKEREFRNRDEER